MADNNTTLIVVGIILFIVILVGAGVTFYFLTRDDNNNNNNNNNNGPPGPPSPGPPSPGPPGPMTNFKICLGSSSCMSSRRTGNQVDLSDDTSLHLTWNTSTAPDGTQIFYTNDSGTNLFFMYDNLTAEFRLEKSTDKKQNWTNGWKIGTNNTFEAADGTVASKDFRFIGASVASNDLEMVDNSSMFPAAQWQFVSQ